MNNSKVNIEQLYKTQITLWFALLFSQFMLLGVIFFFKPELYKFDLTKPLFGENPVLVMGLVVAGLTVLAGSFIVKHIFIRQAIEKQEPILVQTAMITACAMCEACSLFGFVLAFAEDYQYFFLWFGLGIFGTLLHFPLRSNLIDASFQNKI